MAQDTGNLVAARNAASVLALLPDVALVLDEMARVCFASTGTAEMLGSRPRDWVGSSLLDRIHPGDHSAFVERMTAAQQRQPTPTTALEVRVRASDNQWSKAAAHGFVQVDTPALFGTLVLLRDVTGALSRDAVRSAALQRVFDRSNHDHEEDDREWITTEVLPKLIARADASGPLVAVIVMSLSEQDAPAGSTAPGHIDNAVSELAFHLRKQLRTTDVLLRLGDSQLVVICPELLNLGDAPGVAQRLHHWCNEAKLSGAPIDLRTGVSVASKGDDPRAVIEFAESPIGMVVGGAPAPSGSVKVSARS